MSYFREINVHQDCATVSTLNSFSANVGANTTVTGTGWDEVVNQSGLQFVGIYNREVTVTLEQSIDGITPIIEDDWTFLRNVGFSKTVTSAAPYYRIKIQNHNATLEAQGSLVSAATAIISPLPRSTSETGGLITTTYGMSDYNNFAIDANINGDLRVATPFRLVGTQFDGSALDTNFWTAANVGSGVTTVSGDLLLDTAATANSSSTVTSVRVGRYIPSIPHKWRSQLTLGDTGVANNSRKWGAFDAAGQNGCYFELDGTGLYIVTLKGNAPTRVVSTDWNYSRIIPTLTNCQTYEIQWNNKAVYFLINDILSHKVTATTATWSNTMHLGIKLSTTNTLGLGSSRTLRARTASIVRLGAEKTSPIYKHIAGAATTQCKSGPGTLHSIIVNKPGTLCTVVDNISGTTPAIAIIDCDKTTGIVSQAQFDCPFFTGLRVITTGAVDITVIYE